MKGHLISVNMAVLGIGIIFQLCTFVQSANIMFFYGLSSYSHRISAWPLVEELAERGHSVTFVSPFPAKKPNPKVTDYVPQSLKIWTESFNESASFYDTRVANQLSYEWFKMPMYGIGICEVLMDDPEFVKWIKESKFDLVVIDAVLNDCAYGIAYKLNAKTILYNTANGFPWNVDPIGYPAESSWIPDIVFYYPHDMSLYQRIVNALVPIYFVYLREVEYFPKLEAIIREKLDVPDLPSFSDLERDISLFFVNQHFAEDFPRPFPPNVIPLGGLQCSDKPEKLPKDLEDFLKKGGDQEFIYVSFGSMAELSKFPKHVQDVFTNTMKRLKNIQVIWKTEIERPTDLPENIFVGKWMPQQAILSHPKIRAFVTHAGLLGIQEAIWSAVPLIAFPIFAEQDYNAVKIQERGIGIHLEITSVTEAQLYSSIKDVLTNDKYARNMKQVSKVFRDRPAKPLDTAVWWTEYVLRHDNMDLIKPQSIYQSWWKKRSLDVWAVLFGLVVITLKLLINILKLVYSITLRNGSNKLKKS